MSSISHFNLEANSAHPFHFLETERGSQQLQTVLIISGVASTVFLSAIGVFSPIILSVATISVLSFFSFVAVAAITSAIYECIFSEPLFEKVKDSNYENSLKEMGPFHAMVTTPIKEEIIYRGIIQGGTELALKQILPSVSLTILGSQIPLATAIATLTAGTLFGIAHLSNDHSLATYQAIYAGVSGVFCEGMLFNTYGIGASCLAHIINNTIAAGLFFLSSKSE